MQTSLLKRLALVALVMSPFAAISSQAATLFSRAEVDQSKFVAVAAPYAGGTAHQLLVIEQQSSARPCWSEQGSAPTIVNPLLAQFDFTGICGRSIDSNGYSIRMADEDLGWRYSVRVVRRNGDLLLVGVPATNRNAPELQIGRANGFTNGFTKLTLNPGWRMTKRVFNGQTMGHVYLTNDQSLNSAIATAPRPTSPLPTAPISKPLPPVPPVSSTRPTLPKPLPPVASTRPTPPVLQPLPKPPIAGVPIPVPPPESVGRPGTTPTQPLPRPLNAGDFVVPTVEVFP